MINSVIAISIECFFSNAQSKVFLCIEKVIIMLSIINNWRSLRKSCGSVFKKQANKNVDRYTYVKICESVTVDFNCQCFTVNIFGLFLFVLWCSLLYVTKSTKGPFSARSCCDPCLHSIIWNTIDNLIISSDHKLRVSWQLCVV